MRRDVHRAQFIDEVLRTIGLVGTERGWSRPVGVRPDHLQGVHPVDMPVRQGETGVDQQGRAGSLSVRADGAHLRLLAAPP